ncbi:MAG: hypothetical protein VZT48_13425, partial [Bulleidia sp.]|nr:hypothetical protein [Bulleidia sp.]
TFSSVSSASSLFSTISFTSHLNDMRASDSSSPVYGTPFTISHTWPTNYNAERIAGTGNNYGGLVGQGLASSSTVYENIDQWEVDTPVYNDQHWRENKALGDMTFAAWAVIFDMDTGTPVYYFGYMGKEQASSLLK